MSVQQVTRYAGVCDGCDAATASQLTTECALDAAARAGWTNTSFGLLCPHCQRCTECDHNSGPTQDGRLCFLCRSVVCTRCGHTRRAHHHYPNSARLGLTARVCVLLMGEHVECDCPFEAPAEVSADG